MCVSVASGRESLFPEFKAAQGYALAAPAVKEHYIPAGYIHPHPGAEFEQRAAEDHACEQVVSYAHLDVDSMPVGMAP